MVRALPPDPAMTDPRTPSFAVPDAQRAADLRRIKWLATSVLVGCLALMVVGKMLMPHHAAFGFVAAFGEAAAIGGLADWYAVVALFRRPLGLPIPHTAIIQNNRDRIADKLGEFIERNFLDAAPVEARLRQIDFAAFIAAWLGDRDRSEALARFALKLLPEAVAASEASGLKAFLGRRALALVQSVELAPLAAGALRGFVAHGRHHGLFDELMRAAHEALNRPETLAMIREKIRNELPTLLRFYRADAFMLKKLAASATAFFEEVRGDPEHPLRGEFTRMVLALIDRLETEPAFAGRLDGLRRDLLARPEVGRLTERLWGEVRDFVARSASGESSVLERHLAGLLAEAGAQLAADAGMRAEINAGFVTVLRSFIAEHKGGVASFIADQVKGWNIEQAIELIEVNIGRDLQYIRFNGTVIGGLAGLALHSAEVALRSL
jgi:uncharacterized membrane-anchored protein YjiN (DUF445 family)